MKEVTDKEGIRKGKEGKEAKERRNKIVDEAESRKKEDRDKGRKNWDKAEMVIPR